MKLFGVILLLFLCSIPILYFSIYFNSTGTDKVLTSVYVIARILRFLVLIVISCVIRKSSREILVCHMLLRKKVMNFVFCLICVSIWLHVVNITPPLYYTVSDMVGIYHLENTPLLLSVLWEQLFSGDLYWSILLSLSIVFFSCPTPPDKGTHRKSVSGSL